MKEKMWSWGEVIKLASEGQATLTFIGQGPYVRTRMKGIYYNHN